MPCEFQVYSRVIQLHIHMYPFFTLFSPLGYYIILSKFPVLYGRSFWLIRANNS